MLPGLRITACVSMAAARFGRLRWQGPNRPSVVRCRAVLRVLLATGAGIVTITRSVLELQIAVQGMVLGTIACANGLKSRLNRLMASMVVNFVVFIN